MLNVIQYTKIFLMTFVMTLMFSNVSYGWSGEGPTPSSVWFTTQPPASLSVVSSATLIPVTMGLRKGKTYYFNIYVDFISSGVVKFYTINSSGTAVECTLNTDCTSAILKVWSSSFMTCVDFDLSSANHGLVPAKMVDLLSANNWRVKTIGCSDVDTCEGKVQGATAWSLAEGHDGLCFANYAFPGWGGQSIRVKSPVYMLLSANEAGLVSDVLSDFTIGISITGTDANPQRGGGP
jgi:hypothetical protein